jgi:hypothetical protein
LRQLNPLNKLRPHLLSKTDAVLFKDPEKQKAAEKNIFGSLAI